MFYIHCSCFFILMLTPFVHGVESFLKITHLHYLQIMVVCKILIAGTHYSYCWVRGIKSM
jgi:hypothetical protein